MSIASRRSLPNVFALLSLVVSGACIRPNLRPAPPDLSNAKPQVVDTSIVNVPIHVALATVRAAADAAIPTNLHADPYNVQVDGGPDNCGVGLGFGYDINRDPIGMSAAGNRISASAGLAYWIKVRARKKLLICTSPIDVGCGDGEGRRHATATLTSAVTVAPPWRLVTQTTVSPTQAGDECKVSFLNIDVTPQAMAAFDRALGSASAQIDAHVGDAADLRSRVAEAWSLLGEPIQVASDTWLAVRPVRLGVASLQGSPQELAVGVQLVAMPVISVGPKPTVDQSPLPDAAAAPGGNALDLTVPIDVATSEIEHRLDSLFHNVRYPATGRVYLRARRIDVYGEGNRAVMRVTFDGSARGTIYLVGTPAYDAARNTLSVPDLDFTLETKNVLLKLAGWLGRDALRDDLRARATVDLSGPVTRARAMAQAALNRQVGALSLSGSVNTLRVLGVNARPGEPTFRVLAAMTGTLSAEVVPTNARTATGQ